MSTLAEDSTTPTVEEGTSSTAIFPTETLSKSQAETETNVSATPSADKGKTRAVTIEDAPESDDEEQQNVDVRVEAATTTGAAVYMKAQEEPLDPIEAAIRRAEQGAGGDGGGEHQGGQQWGQEHDWQAVWSPPQNGESIVLHVSHTSFSVRSVSVRKTDQVLLSMFSLHLLFDSLL